MDARISSTSQSPDWKEEKGSFHHTWFRFREWFKARLESRPVLTVSATALLAFVIFWQRDHLQPHMLTLRIYFGAIVVVVPLMIAGYYLFRKRSARIRLLGSVLGGMLAAVVIFAGRGVHEAVSQYVRYETMPLVELTEMPVTDYERTLPLHGVYTLVEHRMNQATRSPSQPSFVRDGSEYAWTMAIQPTTLEGRYWKDRIDAVLKLGAEDPSPDLSRTPPTAVDFEAGENLGLGANLATCVRRAFGPWQFFNDDIGNVYYIKDDAGNYVIAVSLIKWTGWIFPWPERGGVQIIEQGHLNMVSRALLGCGHFVPPDEVKNHPFLLGQNNVPDEMTRFMASSFKFQGGLTAPMFWNRTGVVEIADLPDGVNPQPFKLYFRMPGEKQGKLFAYFALKPADPNKQGLAISFFYPADGIGPAYVYRHSEHNESPLGVTQVATQLVASKRLYDWEKNIAVEHRPYIRDIADSEGHVARREFWLSTVVTLTEKREEGKPLSFEPGAVPEIALTDWATGEVVWVNPYDPSGWPAELEKQLGTKWAAKRKAVP